MGDPRVAAIIQARMGSTRFPGKVLKPLAGKPVLWHIIHRLRKCRAVDDIAVATTINRDDDPLSEFCRKQQIPCIRGSSDNILERYRQAAEQLDAGIIVRVTGDSPLIDPTIIDRLVEQLILEKADYCTGDPDTPSIHEGFSPFTRKALERLAREAANDPAAKEHVTAYFKEHPDRFQTAYIRLPQAHDYKGARVSVDTPADLKFLEEVYRRLGAPAGEASVAEVVRLLRADPELGKINSRVRQKTARERTRRAMIRCDGDTEIGLGHVVRCLALAQELTEAHSWGVTFAMMKGDPAFEIVQKAGFSVQTWPGGAGEVQWVDGLLAQIQPDVLILDVRSGLNRQDTKRWKRKGVLIADIDDPEDKRLEADLVFYPPVPQVKEMDWNGFQGHLFTGWEWVALRRQFADPPNPPGSERHDPPVVLITMGGSDPAGMALKTAKALDWVKVPFKAVFVVGEACRNTGTLKDLLKTVGYPHEVKSGVQDMAGLMAGSDLAVASFGVTAYELSAVGVPAVYLCLTEDHCIAADFFEKNGLGVNLGYHLKVSRAAISRNVEELLKDAGMRREMTSPVSSKIDGLGTRRIAKKIVECSDERSG